jgi:hypothetical protein
MRDNYIKACRMFFDQLLKSGDYTHRPRKWGFECNGDFAIVEESRASPEPLLCFP